MKYSEYIEKFNILKKMFKDYKINYFTLIHLDDWEFKSDKILIRDLFCCTKCKAVWNPNIIRQKYENGVCFRKIKDKWVNESEYKEWLDKMKKKPKVVVKVYHKYFQINKLLWDYPDDALETLCDKCHFEKIKQNKIEIRDENMNLVKKINICYKCNGTGFIEKYDYINGGECFDCKGNGYDDLDLEFNS